MKNAIKTNIIFLMNLLRHKWYVLIESCKLGIPWHGLTHDLSKLTPREWIPRVRAYQKGFRRLEDFSMLSEKEKNDLDMSWLNHYNNNPHHWQWWVAAADNGRLIVLPMTDTYRREMLADWRAVSRIPGRMKIIPWYLKNKDNIILHPETRNWIEAKLNISKGKAPI